ncbi:MAG TPA: hypothetical protein VGY94_11715 [Acidobacteriaceae bacterium]|jgi:hypothetical protein|nr:hypothetical protein [Acidobacteriaceae bacterium]
MARRAVFAAFVITVAIPALAQQPVYPRYPPPPPASEENAPHTSPDPSDQQGYPEQSSPDQQQTNQAPQKPSPYPPSDQQIPQQGQEQGTDQYGQPAGPPPSYPQQSAPYPQQNTPYPQQSAPAYPPSGNSLGWVPQGMEALGRTAAFHTDFTFDRSMLQLASGIWEGPGDPGLADAISRLDGISVHSYHYAAPGMYDPRLVEVVRRQYSALGWQHLVTAHSASTSGATDLWISFHHMRATGAVVLFQGPTNLNLIAFSGNLSPLDLLHLRGHFGIPRFPGDSFVPAPGQAARAGPPPRY